MARTIVEIENIMIAEKEAQPSLDGLTSTSNTSIWRLWINVIANGIFSLEKLFDLFVLTVKNLILNLKPGTPRWYVYMVKKFQFGFDLVQDQDYYDNTGVPDDVVAASKIIAYAAFVEEPFVRMKLAKLVGSDLAKLTTDERLAVVAYVNRFKYAGIDLNANTITSTDPDKLRLVLRVKYNPLVLNNLGARLDGTNPEPVKTGVKAYLKNLDFNGLFSTQKLVDQLQAVEGVDDLSVDNLQTKYGALPFTSVDINFVPDSGYLIIDDVDLLITYQPS